MSINYLSKMQINIAPQKYAKNVQINTVIAMLFSILSFFAATTSRARCKTSFDGVGLNISFPLRSILSQDREKGSS